jgi:hypothetical protein
LPRPFGRVAIGRCGLGSGRLLRDGGRLSAARGPLYRVENAQVLQAVARAHHRLRRAAYDRAEIFELSRQRISPFDGNCLAFERVRPGPSCRVGVESQAHGGKRQRAKCSGDDVTIFVGIGGEGFSDTRVRCRPPPSQSPDKPGPGDCHMSLTVPGRPPNGMGSDLGAAQTGGWDARNPQTASERADDTGAGISYRVIVAWSTLQVPWGNGLQRTQR